MNKNTGMIMSISKEVPQTFDKEGFEALNYTSVPNTKADLSFTPSDDSGKFFRMFKNTKPIQPYNVFRIDEGKLNNEKT